MEIKNKKELLVKFPEDKPLSDTPITATSSAPNNLVDKAAEFLPRALSSMKENFKEAVFLIFVLGYIFIAAFGHMEKIQDYIGYISIFLVSIIFYNLSKRRS